MLSRVGGLQTATTSEYQFKNYAWGCSFSAYCEYSNSFLDDEFMPQHVGCSEACQPMGGQSLLRNLEAPHVSKRLIAQHKKSLATPDSCHRLFSHPSYLAMCARITLLAGGITAFLSFSPANNAQEVVQGLVFN
jgi:hypothetical protein